MMDRAIKVGLIRAEKTEARIKEIPNVEIHIAGMKRSIEDIEDCTLHIIPVEEKIKNPTTWKQQQR